MAELYLKNGEKAGLYDVCKWFIEGYPDDIFISKPEEVIEIRKQAKEILRKGGRLGDKQNVSSLH